MFHRENIYCGAFKSYLKVFPCANSFVVTSYHELYESDLKILCLRKIYHKWVFWGNDQFLVCWPKYWCGYSWQSFPCRKNIHPHSFVLSLFLHICLELAFPTFSFVVQIFAILRRAEELQAFWKHRRAPETQKKLQRCCFKVPCLNKLQSSTTLKCAIEMQEAPKIIYLVTLKWISLEEHKSNKINWLH